MQEISEDSLPKEGSLVVLGYYSDKHTEYSLVEVTGYVLDCLTGEGCYDPDYSTATHFQVIDKI